MDRGWAATGNTGTFDANLMYLLATEINYTWFQSFSFRLYSTALLLQFSTSTTNNCIDFSTWKDHNIWNENGIISPDSTTYTVRHKNTLNFFYQNLKKGYPILIISGTHIHDTTGHQMAV